MSRYQTWRRRLAPIAFAVAIALIARDTCNKQQRIHATIVVELGAATADARALDADIYVGEDMISQFHKAALPNSRLGVTQFEAVLPTADVDLRIDVDLGTRHVEAARRLHVIDGSTVTIPLADALAPTAPPSGGALR